MSFSGRLDPTKPVLFLWFPLETNQKGVTFKKGRATLLAEHPTRAASVAFGLRFQVSAYETFKRRFQPEKLLADAGLWEPSAPASACGENDERAGGRGSSRGPMASTASNL